MSKQISLDKLLDLIYTKTIDLDSIDELKEAIESLEELENDDRQLLAENGYE